MKEAKSRGADIVVYPELALTTFFPRWWMEDDAEIDSFFEREMPNPATRPLFEAAESLGVGFYLGYAEIEREGGKTHHYNTSILVDKKGAIVGKYRKVHLPGHAITGRTIHFSISRSGISSPETWAFRYGAP